MIFLTSIDPGSVERHDFASSAPMDTICERREFALELAGLGFVDSAISAARDLSAAGSLIRCTGSEKGSHRIRISGAEPALVQIDVGGFGYAPDIARHNFMVHATGSRNFVLRFFETLRKRYGDARLATVTWWFKGEHGAEIRTVPIEPSLPIHDEFYPWLREGVDAYVDRFLADRASILFLMGPPGTGKTSLLRHMIYSRQLAATVTYEECLLATDAMFVNFLCASEAGVLVIEDADLMVGSRESEGNKLISRFLNVSDGLIKTRGKKIVFTTNLGDFRHVDPALVRSGRCFDAIRFRPMTYREAIRACEVAGIEPPSKEADYTLADLFGTPNTTPLELAAVGF